MQLLSLIQKFVDRFSFIYAVCLLYHSVTSVIFMLLSGWATTTGTDKVEGSLMVLFLDLVFCSLFFHPPVLGNFSADALEYQYQMSNTVDTFQTC